MTQVTYSRLTIVCVTQLDDEQSVRLVAVLYPRMERRPDFLPVENGGVVEPERGGALLERPHEVDNRGRKIDVIVLAVQPQTVTDAAVHPAGAVQNPVQPAGNVDSHAAVAASNGQWATKPRWSAVRAATEDDVP